MVSKQVDRPYMPGNRGVWVKTKFLNRQEFVVVGWTDPEGSRSSLGSLLLGYYRDDGKLIYAGRAGHGHDGIRTEGLAEKAAPARLGQDDRRRAAAENLALRQAARACRACIGCGPSWSPKSPF